MHNCSEKAGEDISNNIFDDMVKHLTSVANEIFLPTPVVIDLTICGSKSCSNITTSTAHTTC